MSLVEVTYCFKQNRLLLSSFILIIRKITRVNVVKFSRSNTHAGYNDILQHSILLKEAVNIHAVVGLCERGVI